MAAVAPPSPYNFRNIAAVATALVVPPVLLKMSETVTPLVSGIMRGLAVWYMLLGFEIGSSTSWKESVIRLAVTGAITVGIGMLEAALEGALNEDWREDLRGATIYPSLMISLCAMSCLSARRANFESPSVVPGEASEPGSVSVLIQRRDAPDFDT